MKFTSNKSTSETLAVAKNGYLTFAKVEQKYMVDEIINLDNV
jgi:hypothetical protein